MRARGQKGHCQAAVNRIVPERAEIDRLRRIEHDMPLAAPPERGCADIGAERQKHGTVREIFVRRQQGGGELCAGRTGQHWRVRGTGR